MSLEYPLELYISAIHLEIFGYLHFCLRQALSLIIMMSHSSLLPSGISLVDQKGYMDKPRKSQKDRQKLSINFYLAPMARPSSSITLSLEEKDKRGIFHPKTSFVCSKAQSCHLLFFLALANVVLCFEERKGLRSLQQLELLSSCCKCFQKNFPKEALVKMLTKNKRT